MTDALTFLQSVSGYMQGQRAGSADKPCLLGVIDPAYAGLPALPKVTFEGESTLSGKTYPHLASYVPVPSDRVVLVPVGTTYLILGPVAATTGAVALAGNTLAVAGASTLTGALAANGGITVAGSALDVGVWQTYTPSWTAVTTNPTIGNGTLSGRYVYLNKHTIQLVIRVSCGSTTTKGTGAYRLSLPVTSADGTGLGYGATGTFSMNDSGSALRTGSVVFVSTTTIELWVNGTGGAFAAANFLGSVTGSFIDVALTYEV